MVNDGIQPDPVFIISLFFQYQHNPCPLPGLDRIVKGLADGFSPFVSEVHFNGVGTGKAIAPGFVWKYHFHLAVVKGPLHNV